MIWLAIVALLITSVTVWYLVRPLRQTKLADEHERAHQLQLVRGRLLTQLNELDLEEADKNIDASVLNDERERLEAELAKVLRELKTLTSTGKKKKEKLEPRHAWVAALVALGITLPLSAAGLYALTQRATLDRLINPQAVAEGSVPPMVMEMVARLEQRLSEQPDDADGWFRMARAYAVLGRPDAANAAYARAYKLNPDNPQLVSEYAGFLYNNDPQNLNAQVIGLFGRLHELDPENRDAMWILGFAAYQKADYKKALGLWERLLKALPADSREAEHLRMIVAKAREQLGKK
ncbi:MAG: tetratricopeptide repeat protein [Gammaproteobacteria bacterium]|nr:tetratricopeptide repeat protein [Gammaproteobacteria bacterium]